MVLAPKLAEFAYNSPDAILDVATVVSRDDLVAAHADARLHRGEYIDAT
jgi:hypothetical protein